MSNDDRKTLDLQELKEKFTIDGKPAFSEIKLDPATGDLLGVEFTPEVQEKLKGKAQAIKAAAAEIADGTGLKAEEVRAAYKQAQEYAESIKAAANEVLNNTLSKETLTQWRDMLEQARPVMEALDELSALEPYIEAELKKPEYNGATLDDLLKDLLPRDLLQLPEDGLLYKALQAARAERAKALPVIDSHRTKTLNTPTDRVNFLAWNNFKETGKQIAMAFDLRSERDKNDPAKSGLDISMRYSLSFGDDPNIKTTKELNHYDRRLMQAADTLYTSDASGQGVFLIGDIFRAMGGKTEPNSTQRRKMNDALTKQGTARVFMDNATEAAHYKYPHIEYDGNILNFERIKVMYNGQEVEAIHFLRRPVFMELAAGRKQITDIPLKVLQSGVSQTDDHLRIEDYLLQRIVRQKNDLRELLDQQDKKYVTNREPKISKARKLTILLDTFYEQIGKADKKKDLKQRALKTAERYLDHYRSDAGGRYIDSYKITDDRITITLPRN